MKNVSICNKMAYLKRFHCLILMKDRHFQIQSDPAISNTQGKQKLVRYSKVRYIRTIIKANPVKGKRKTVQYSGGGGGGGSLYPVFDVAKFDCISKFK